MVPLVLSLIVALSFAGLQGVLINCLTGRAFRRVSGWVQMGSMAFLITVLFLTPLMAGAIRPLFGINRIETGDGVNDAGTVEARECSPRPAAGHERGTFPHSTGNVSDGRRERPDIVRGDRVSSQRQAIE